MNMKNLSVSAKILLAIAVLGLATATISALSYIRLEQLSVATDEIDLTSREIRNAARINRLAVELSRAEYRLALNPADYDEVAPAAGDRLAQLEESIGQAHETADETQKELLEPVDTLIRKYQEAFRNTLSLAERFAKDSSMSAQQEQMLAQVSKSRAIMDDLSKAIVTYNDFTDQKGTRISTEASASAENSKFTVLVVAIVGLITGIGLGVFIASKGIVQPIRKIVDCLRALANGNLEVDVFGTDRRDEVGEVAKTTLIFKENMIKARQLEQEIKENEKRAAEQRKREMHELADNFERSVGGIVKSVSSASTEMQASAQSLSAIAEETNKQSIAVASASEQASANVQTVASATEELSASIEEVNGQIVACSRMAQEAAQDAQRSNDAVSNLKSASGRIDEVVKLIEDIAEQTNLLALNATIEAARAGDAGRGFAVVANEVKTLAGQTAKATQEIAQQIAEMQMATTASVNAVEAIARKIVSINEATALIAAAAEEQASATREISGNVQQAAVGTQEVSNNITGVTQAAGETGTMSSQTLSAATELSEQSEVLAREVRDFVARVRAA